MKHAVIAASAAGLSLAAIGVAPAVAAQTQERTMVVEYSDLNLETAQGQKILKRRIDKAAKAFCQVDRVETGSRIRNPASLMCYKQAKAAAHEQLAAIVSDQQLGG